MVEEECEEEEKGGGAIASCLSAAAAATIIVGREFVEGGGEDGKGVEDCVSEKGVDAFPEKKSRALYIIHPHHQFDPLLLLPRLLKYYCCSCSLIVVVVAAVLHLPRPTAASTAISNVGEISGGKKKIQNRSDTPF